MNNGLISRAEAIEVIRSMQISLGGKEIFHPEAKRSVLRALDDIPAVDAEPVRHGRWEVVTVPKKYGGFVVLCSECNTRGARIWNYCHDCGAKMDLEVQDE